MPLAAYGGSGMEEDEPSPTPDVPAEPTAAAATAAAPESPVADLPVPEDEPAPRGPSPVKAMVERIVRLFRTSRVAAGAGFAVVIVVGLVLLSSGGASPAATAATPTNGPTAAPTVVPPSGNVSMTTTGAAAGTFSLAGLAGGQQIGGGAVALTWGDAQQTTLSITGPLDRGTRATDEHLVLTVGVLVNGAAVTFTSAKGECTIGMAEVGTDVQGSFTCHKLKGPDGKLTIEASGIYHS